MENNGGRNALGFQPYEEDKFNLDKHNQINSALGNGIPTIDQRVIEILF